MQSFTLDVMDECNAISRQITHKDIANRVDLRDNEIYTIDGEDAKDLDDAVCVQRLPDGGYKLGVHIADVSHYVAENTAIDAEAYNRGTSIYLIDEVIPMLPPLLSNDLCSLHPNTDKLTLSVFIEFSKSGERVNYTISPSVINTRGRMNYTEITKLLGGDMATRKRLSSVIPTFELMRELALKLRDKRVERGSLDFDLPEPKLQLDRSKKPLKVGRAEIGIANLIIEEFMLAANETVAEHLTKAGFPLLYRVHELPNETKLTALKQVLKEIGIKFDTKKVSVKTLQDILFSIKGKHNETVVSSGVLRSMMKAAYSAENLGHFALAAENYCHFTSPIRRYPDLIVHRMVKESLEEAACKDRNRLRAHALYMSRAATDTKDAESLAVNLEREWTDYKLAEFMHGKLGQQFTGTICSITSFGFFVTLHEFGGVIDGLVHMKELANDYFEYTEGSAVLVGRHTGMRYRLGDTIEVQLQRVNVEERQIDFAPVDSIREQKKTSPDKKVKKDKSESVHFKEVKPVHGKRGKRKTLQKNHRSKQKGKT